MSGLADRLAAALGTLVGDGTLKERLIRAYADHLESLAEAELPVQARSDFAHLAAALTRVAPMGSETRVRASVQKMSSREAVSYAQAILKLYVDLVEPGERAEPLKVISASKKPHRYLAKGP
jgi:hypothetical protein